MHPESVIHALVEFTDGSVKAQLAEPDMRLPIQYALLWDRLPSPAARLDWSRVRTLRFEGAPDDRRYPCLAAVLETARSGDLAAMIGLSAADELAVARFLRGEIRFDEIASYLRRGASLGAAQRAPAAPDLGEILGVDRAGAHRSRSGAGAGVTEVEFLPTLIIFLLTFTVIIAVHEFGHYLTARLLGMKVLEFAFGFPPRLFAIRHAEIDYSVNAIPFGGFVRILGQDDFSIRQAGEGQPGSFTSKPWWSQAIVLAAGVTMNMVLALFVLTIAFATGTTASTGDVRVREVAPDSPASRAGFQTGDIVRAIDGRKIERSNDLVNYVRAQARLSPDKEVTLEVERNGRPLAADQGRAPCRAAGGPGSAGHRPRGGSGPHRRATARGIPPGRLAVRSGDRADRGAARAAPRAARAERRSDGRRPDRDLPRHR